MAAKVFEQHGIKLGEDDPAFALVTLNELTLRKVMGELLQEVDQHINARLAEFELAMQRVEGRAGKLLAHQVRDSAAGLQGALHEEIISARLGVQQMVEEIRKTHRAATLARWCAVGAVVGSSRVHLRILGGEVVLKRKEDWGSVPQSCAGQDL